MDYSTDDLLKLYSDAEFYDIEFSRRKQEIPFFKKWVTQLRGRVLEVACGTGRITIPLALAGINIEGRDLSPNMIEQARKKVKDMSLHDLKFEVEDCRNTDGSFDLIFSATNAIQHLLKDEDVVSFLESCHRSLSKNGRLILDLQNPNEEKLARDLNEPYNYKSFNIRETEYHAFLSGKYNKDQQLFSFNVDYYLDEEKIKEKKIVMRQYFPDKIQELITQGNFLIEHQFGDYDESELSANSDRQIYVLKKQKNKPKFVDQ